MSSTSVIMRSQQWKSLKLAETVMLFVIFSLFQCYTVGIAQALKKKTRFGKRQRESITIGYLVQNPFKQFSEAFGDSTEETEEDIETCNHDVVQIVVRHSVQY